MSSNSEPLCSASQITVDKIVIAQDSLQRFINAISPGAYASITKVDFKMLDRFMIKPLGVYGSKLEIVKLLRSLGAVDDNTYVPLHILIIHNELCCQGSLIDRVS